MTVYQRVFLLFMLSMAALVLVAACSSERVDDDRPSPSAKAQEASDAPGTFDGIDIDSEEPTFVLTDEEWRQRLSDKQYNVLRREGTERAFTGALHGNERDGTYHCAGCGHPVFSSTTRFDSGTGWPSFSDPLTDDAVGTKLDDSLGQTRVEVHCRKCGGHLGHIFPDGPQPTGLRYCLNSAALSFDEPHP